LRSANKVAWARADRFEPLQQRPLCRVDLFGCRDKVEPFGTVDLRKCLAATAARRPFDLERVAPDRSDVYVNFNGKRRNGLAAALSPSASKS
jgi:hypothetical protein